MRTYDMTPLFRTSVGFDRLSRFMDTALQLENAGSAYPPYNIIKQDENSYDITLAVAGFAETDLTLEVKESTLTVSGRSDASSEGVEYLHRGIAGRAFTRRFQLADHIKVLAATIENGLLTIGLAREIPEALRPRTIPIQSIASVQVAAK
jgi:molecular chaperone IbpA